MESPPRDQVAMATQLKSKTPGSVKKFAKRMMGSAKKRRLDREDRVVKRNKSSNEFDGTLFDGTLVQKAVPRKMQGATKMLTEMALNSPKIATEKIKKVKATIVGTPMKVAGMIKRNKSLYSRTPKGETKAVDEWNKRIVRKDVHTTNNGTLWQESEWATLHQGLSREEVKLQEIFNEFIVKELSYKEAILQIRTVYMKAFSTCDFSQFDESRDEIAEDLFANINEIVDLQVGFGNDLIKMRGESKGLIRNFGSFFTEWVTKFGPYVPYCGHIMAMKKRYDGLLDRSENFSRLVKQLQLMEKCEKKCLWTLLDEPRRHFLRYNLMLKSAVGQLQKIKASSENDTQGDLDEDITNLTEALAVVNQLGEDMNKGVDVIGDYLVMRALRNNLHFTNEDERQGFTIPETSVLLFHGMLTNRDGKGIHVFLTSHFLVFTRESRRGGKATYQVPRNMKPVGVKDLDVRLVEMNDPGAINFGRTGSMIARTRNTRVGQGAKKTSDDHLSMMHIVDHGDQAIFTLRARSIEGRDAWVHAIREVGVVANVKSQTMSASKPLKRVQLMDLNALPSPSQAEDPQTAPQDPTVTKTKVVNNADSPVKSFSLSEGDDQFMQLRSKLQFSENTPHVTPPRPSVRDTIVGEGDATIKKFDFGADGSQEKGGAEEKEDMQEPPSHTPQEENEDKQGSTSYAQENEEIQGSPSHMPQEEKEDMQGPLSPGGNDSVEELDVAEVATTAREEKLVNDETMAVETEEDGS